MPWHLDIWHVDCSFQSSLVRLTAVAYPELDARSAERTIWLQYVRGST